MEAISSADFQNNNEPADPLTKSPNKYDEMLNNAANENPTKTFASDKPQVNSF